MRRQPPQPTAATTTVSAARASRGWPPVGNLANHPLIWPRQRGERAVARVRAKCFCLDFRDAKLPPFALSKAGSEQLPEKRQNPLILSAILRELLASGYANAEHSRCTLDFTPKWGRLPTCQTSVSLAEPFVRQDVMALSDVAAASLEVNFGLPGECNHGVPS